MMYEIDPTAAPSPPSGLPSAFIRGGDGGREYRDDRNNNHNNHDSSPATQRPASGQVYGVYRSSSNHRSRYPRDDEDSDNDDEIVILPASLRRIFVAGGAAFLVVVLLAASTMSVVVDPGLTLPGSTLAESSSSSSGAAQHGGMSVAPNDLLQRDEQATFASSMLSLMQELVDETVQIVGDAVDDEGDNDEGTTNSPTLPPIVKKTPPPTTSFPVSPPVAAPTSDPPAAATSPTTAPDANGITEGSVNGVAYYSCRATSDVEKTILLFHGASLTKEQWKDVGILDTLCSQPTLTMYAFDLSVSSGADDLQALLDVMLQSNLILSLPVNAIVTPSASGSMVVDWGQRTVANESSFAPMSDYWNLWVPVASPAVAYVDPKSLLSSMFPNIEILAVHGDQDTSGGRVMGLLETYAGAKLVTIDGGHACYMQSPDDFVQAVLAEVM